MAAGIDIWQVARIVLLACGLVLAGGAGLALYRLRGVLNWKRSLSEELALLRRIRHGAESHRRAALELIVTRCDGLQGALAPEPERLADLPDFVRAIAACYHPHSARPELQVAVGPLLNSAAASLERLDLILRRPGLQRLEWVRLRDIRRIHGWYRHLTRARWYRWYRRHRNWLQRLGRLRLLVWPDPLQWAVFLSNRLLLLSLSKYLLVDIYIFVGKLALEAYAPDATAPGPHDPADLEALARHLDQLTDEAVIHPAPAVRRLRQNLVGLPAALWLPPDAGRWKNAVTAAAEIIARRHFPESAEPLLEAATGPLLRRTRIWLATLCRAERLPLAGRLYGLRLDTLVGAKNLSEMLLPPPVRRYLQGTLRAYGWLKWPLRVVRWSRNRVPLTIALQLGWAAVGRSLRVYLWGRAFDVTCAEVEEVYRLSRRGRNRRGGRRPIRGGR